MIDLKFLRAEPDTVKANVKKRCKDMDREIDEILELDATRRQMTAAIEAKKAEQNAPSSCSALFRSFRLWVGCGSEF